MDRKLFEANAKEYINFIDQKKEKEELEKELKDKIFFLHKRFFLFVVFIFSFRYVYAKLLIDYCMFFKKKKFWIENLKKDIKDYDVENCLFVGDSLVACPNIDRRFSTPYLMLENEKIKNVEIVAQTGMQLTNLLKFLKKNLKDDGKKYDFIVVCCVINEIINFSGSAKKFEKAFCEIMDFLKPKLTKNGKIIYTLGDVTTSKILNNSENLQEYFNYKTYKYELEILKHKDQKVKFFKSMDRTNKFIMENKQIYYWRDNFHFTPYTYKDIYEKMSKQLRELNILK